MSEWQSIDTVPFTTDWNEPDRWVLVFDTEEGMAVAARRREGPLMRGDGSVYFHESWNINGASGYEMDVDLYHVTHWRSLPEKPR